MKLHANINSSLAAQLKDMYFVGRLATKAEVSGTRLYNVGLLEDGNVQFQIKCLSEIPVELSDCFAYSNRLFAGNTYTQANQRIFNFGTNSNISVIEKREIVEQTLQNKLMVFSMKPTSNQQYININIHEIVEMEHPENEYIIIPSPLLKDDETRKDFEMKISNNARPFTLPSYPNLFKLPEYIYLEGRIYFNLAIKKSQNPTTYFQQYLDEVKYVDVDQTSFNECVVIKSEHNLIHVIPNSTQLDLRDEFEEFGKLLYKTFEGEEILPSEEIQETIKQINKESKNDNLKSEETFFLERLKENALKRGLYYSNEDLYNFHVCMKTNLLTIIGGMSGIGKSQLALLYAETLGMEYGKEVLMLPISPAYTEPNDLLGFLNPNTGIYNESETGLVSLLMRANKNAAADSLRKEDSKLYMVIFDEMNLAQVEHWFSPFISLLEMNEDNRYLHLFNENNHCVNNYKHRIHIGSNVLFVGTVNFDETTKLFSDRLLDRANVFIPGKPTLEEMYDNCYNETVESLEFQPIITYSEKYLNWTNSSENPADKYKLLKHEIEILDMLHRLINEQDRQKGISFRTAKNIAFYMNNIPKDANGTAYISREKAFDLQIKQRVITKIRGIDSFVHPLLGTYRGDEFEPGTITTYLQGFVDMDDPDAHYFKYSIEIIKSKVKELKHYGFAY